MYRLIWYAYELYCQHSSTYNKNQPQIKHCSTVRKLAYRNEHKHSAYCFQPLLILLALRSRQKCVPGPTLAHGRWKCMHALNSIAPAHNCAPMRTMANCASAQAGHYEQNSDITWTGESTVGPCRHVSFLTAFGSQLSNAFRHSVHQL